MNVSLPARAWLVLAAIDLVAFVLVAVGISRDVQLATAAGAVLLVATSVAGVMIQSRHGKQ